jgi:hypothetical protein
MKNIAKFAAVALLVVGSIACDPHKEEPAVTATTTTETMAPATETATVTETSGTVTTTETSLTTPTSTDAAPVPNATDTSATTPPPAQQ